jgi:hypothetical protein
MGAGDGQDMADATLFQLVAEAGIGAVDLVAGHPPGGHSGVEDPDDHLPGQGRLGRELHILGDSGRGPARAVPDP